MDGAPLAERRGSLARRQGDQLYGQSGGCRRSPYRLGVDRSHGGLGVTAPRRSSLVTVVRFHFIVVVIVVLVVVAIDIAIAIVVVIDIVIVLVIFLVIFVGAVVVVVVVIVSAPVVVVVVIVFVRSWY